MFEIHPEMTRRDGKEQRAYLRRVMIVILAGALLAGLSLCAYGAPLYRAVGVDTIVTLTDEPCRLKEIANLPRRITWYEAGVETEGCYGSHRMFPLIIAYFADRSVVVIPQEVFQKVGSV